MLVENLIFNFLLDFFFSLFLFFAFTTVYSHYYYYYCLHCHARKCANTLFRVGEDPFSLFIYLIRIFLVVTVMFLFILYKHLSILFFLNFKFSWILTWFWKTPWLKVSSQKESIYCGCLIWHLSLFLLTGFFLSLSFPHPIIPPPISIDLCCDSEINCSFCSIPL